MSRPPPSTALLCRVACAQAQDKVCQTAQQWLTESGERSKFLGGNAHGLRDAH